MKIVLVTPPSGFLLDQRVFVSLGILKVGAVLEQAGYKVDHLDLTGVSNYEDVARDYVRTLGASILPVGETVFAITATTPQIPAAIRIRNVLRGKAILGGPHCTLLNAAAKHGNERAAVALSQLLETFDTVVAGDGEHAIFRALREYGLIDADDPKSVLWEKNNLVSPWPARHLVDVDSYKYYVDGERALSMIAQLGCLDPGTPIMLDSMRCLPISDVRIGDSVRCFDVARSEFTFAPVRQTWKRRAADIWEVAWDNGTVLRVTSEHPVYTPSGWKQIGELEIGAISASVYPMREEVHGVSTQDSGEILRSDLHGRMAESARESKVVTSGPRFHASEICFYDEGGEESVLRPSSSEYTRDSQIELAKQARESKSDEATGGCAESFGDDQETVGNFFFGTDAEKLEGRKVKVQPEYEKRSTAQQAGTYSGGDSLRVPFIFSVRREWPVLDWPLSLWKTAQSRLFRPWYTKSYLATRRVLAQRSVERNRIGGLLEHGVGAVGSVVQGIKAQEPNKTNPKVNFVWSEIVSKRLIGAGEVCNITVHPHHNYIANGMIVHNCPFECGFCGGRMSPMLRRARPRQFSIDIISEMVHLYETYGVKGMMFLDDELNVNRGLVQLMQGVKATGIEWRLRGFVKAELFTEDQARSMYQAGFRWLLCGFESAHPRILRNINKKATLADNTNMLRIAHAAGLKVKALMSVGHPGESEETVLAIRDWLLQEKPDDFDCTVITVYPGTPYYDRAVHQHDKVYRYEFNGEVLYSFDVDFTKEAAYYKGVPGDYHSFVWTDHISAERLVAMRDAVEDEVRKKLGIPYPTGAAALQYEHTVGMRLPERILKTSHDERDDVGAQPIRLVEAVPKFAWR